MDEGFSSKPDLTDQNIIHPDVESFTDGNSFVQDGTCFARYAVVTLDAVIKAHQLPVRTSAQKADVIALIWALQLTAEVQINIYKDSKYAITTIHVHEALSKEGGSLTQEEKMLSMDKKFWNHQLYEPLSM
jgi:ribonuclease HI